jgi:hypothetical protein
MQWLPFRGAGGTIEMIVAKRGLRIEILNSNNRERHTSSTESPFDTSIVVDSKLSWTRFDFGKQQEENDKLNHRIMPNQVSIPRNSAKGNEFVIPILYNNQLSSIGSSCHPDQVGICTARGRLLELRIGMQSSRL